jgi:lantibiotic biosynthesis protein
VAVITWSPLLSGGLREQALETVQAIAKTLSTGEFGPVEADRGSLVGGHAGLAVFFTYLKQTGLANRRSKVAERLLDEAADAVATTPLTASLFEGFTGVAWATEHLTGRLFDPEGEDANEDIDEALLGYVAQSPWIHDYDLVSGLVGIGVYALERLPRAGAKALLEVIIERLDESAERGTHGVTWHTAPDLLPAWQRDLCPKGHYNLGLAHGVPGIIALLGQACAADVARATAEPMLAKAVAWLLAQRLPANMSSSFSSWTGPGLERDSARSAWCYGDPGIAAALLVAARCVGEPSWEREALALARRATARPTEQARIHEAGLCHGAAGLGHLFNRMGQATADSQLADAARFWFARALEMRTPGRGIAGFAARGADTWAADPGILTGAAGIGLALLAAVTPIEPEWDRILLLSARENRAT